jgi:uncharacterized protein (TIGR00299 family) protein
MKIAYFDCQYGAAGDMLNAALLAAGADEGAWRAGLARLPLPRVELRVTQVERCNLFATKLDVLDEHGASYDFPHGEHAHDHSHLHDILHLIDHASLSPGAESLAKRIFTRLADAESRVHGVRAEDVAFHEVGAVDSIVDIVGFAIAYDSLGIGKSYGSAVAVGSGTVQTQHGLFPVPGPATLYLLESAGVPTAGTNINFECLTPTGAAILCEVVSEWGRQPAMKAVGKVGYGAGTKNPPTWPNVCRVILGDASDTTSGAGASGRFTAESLAVVEANLDDFSPQTLSVVVDRLLEAGALDVTVAPVLMKKGRAGQVLTVLCKPDDRVRLQEQIIEETSSIGVRWYAAERFVANREWQEVELSPGSHVRMKIARDNQGHVVNVQPEFDDCARYAEEHRVPVKQVLIDALAKYKRNGTSSS